MIIIGLCGGSGSGKTTALSMMESLGAGIVDTDLVWRELCVKDSQAMKDIADAFGDDAVAPDGTLDRRRLGAIVFADPTLRKTLNRISHRHIKIETQRRIASFESAGLRAAVIDAPVLFESGFDAMCDVTVAVVASEELRIARIMARDGISRSDAEARISSQIADSELRARCDYIIENEGDRGMLKARVAEFYRNVVGGEDHFQSFGAGGSRS